MRNLKVAEYKNIRQQFKDNPGLHPLFVNDNKPFNWYILLIIQRNKFRYESMDFFAPNSCHGIGDDKLSLAVKRSQLRPILYCIVNQCCRVKDVNDC